MPRPDLSNFCLGARDLDRIPIVPIIQSHDPRPMVYIGFNYEGVDFFCFSYNPETGVFECYVDNDSSGWYSSVSVHYISRDPDHYVLDIMTPIGLQRVAHHAMTPMDLRMDTKATCFACGAIEGQRHSETCILELCPLCGKTLSGCFCNYEFLGLLNRDLFDTSTNFLPLEIYHNGLSQSQERALCDHLDDVGRIPFIKYPCLCGYCGTPHNLIYDHDDWEDVLPDSKQNEPLCRMCFERIKRLIRGAPPPHATPAN